MAGLVDLKKELKKSANPVQAAILQRFFKTGPGEYGEGDIFLGIKVPLQRMIAKKYQELELLEIKEMLESGIHEFRLSALFVLIAQFKKADDGKRKAIFEFYLKHAKRVNNWDLVDLSAPNIVGTYLADKPRGVLYKLVASRSLWERRIAIVSTFTFIRNGEFDDTFLLSEKLLNDNHDLIHKAAGWMLREVGKREKSALLAFLDKHSTIMPRTMLRYAIEKLDEKERIYYLKRK